MRHRRDLAEYGQDLGDRHTQSDAFTKPYIGGVRPIEENHIRSADTLNHVLTSPDRIQAGGGRFTALMR
jgi:hypothetical protein